MRIATLLLFAFCLIAQAQPKLSSIVVNTNHTRRSFALEIGCDPNLNGYWNKFYWWMTNGTPTNIVCCQNITATFSNLPTTNRIYFGCVHVDTNSGLTSAPVYCSFNGWLYVTNPWSVSAGTNQYQFTVGTNRSEFFIARLSTNLLEVLMTTNLNGGLGSFDLWWLTLPPAGTMFPNNPPKLTAFNVQRYVNP